MPTPFSAALFRTAVPALFFLTLTLSSSANPFYTKFGGPYPNADKTFRLKAMEYGGMWSAVFATLGSSGLHDKAGFTDFCKESVNPALDKMTPSTPEERKMKEAAEWVRDTLQHIADPDAFTPEKRKEIETFLDSCVKPGESRELPAQLGEMILYYRTFSMGLSEEQAAALLKKVKEPTKPQSSPQTHPIDTIAPGPP